jgi:hypothetical protein
MSSLQVFQPKCSMHFSSPHACYMPCLFIFLIRSEYKLRISSLCNFLNPHVTSCLLGTNILPSTLFSNILKLHSLFRVTDQVSHPYKPTPWNRVLLEKLSHSTIQEIPCISWKPKVHFYVCKSPPTSPYPEPDESDPMMLASLYKWSSLPIPNSYDKYLFHLL